MMLVIDFCHILRSLGWHLFTGDIKRICYKIRGCSVGDLYQEGLSKWQTNCFSRKQRTSTSPSTSRTSSGLWTRKRYQTWIFREWRFGINDGITERWDGKRTVYYARSKWFLSSDLFSRLRKTSQRSNWTRVIMFPIRMRCRFNNGMSGNVS